MKFDDMGLAFPQECLRAALLVSLLSVWVLVGLFYYLNRYTRREDFSIWTGAWLFYALWLTLSLGLGDAAPGSLLFTVNQSCVSISAVLLLWGSLRFLGIPVPRRLSAVFAIFLAVWVLISPRMMTSALQIHLPVFILLSLSCPFATVCFLRLQKQKAFVGVGMLSLGLLLGVIYIGSYPFPSKYGNLYSAGFFFAAVLQLIIAVSMIVLLFQELRRETQQVRAEIEAVRLERSKIITTETSDERGYDAGKKVNGRKRHILVDTIGLLLMVMVLPANIQDRDGAKRLLAAFFSQATLRRVKHIWADGGYTGALLDWTRRWWRCTIEIVKRSDLHTFKVLPRRWVVERTFGWLGRYRRLNRDYERQAKTGETMVYLAMIRLMLKRLG